MWYTKLKEESLSLVNRLWRRLFPTRDERIEEKIEAAWDEGIGVQQAAFKLAVARRQDRLDELQEDILEWLDHAVWTSRTPYGIDGFSLQMAVANGEEAEDVLAIEDVSLFLQRTYRETHRAEIAETLKRELADCSEGRFLIMSLLRFGDAVEATMFPSPA